MSDDNDTQGWAHQQELEYQEFLLTEENRNATTKSL